MSHKWTNMLSSQNLPGGYEIKTLKERKNNQKMKEILKSKKKKIKN